MPGAGGLIRLPDRVPLQKALEWSLTGEPFTAEDAERYGLINILTEEGGALDAAIALADKITEGGPLAVAKIKEIVVAAPDWPAAERFQKQMEAIAPCSDPRMPPRVPRRSPNGASPTGPVSETDRRGSLRRVVKLLCCMTTGREPLPVDVRACEPRHHVG